MATTKDVRHVVKRSTAKEWGKPLSTPAALLKIKQNATTLGGPYRIKERDGQFGPARTREEMLERVDKRLRAEDVGLWLVVDTDSVAHIWVRTVQVRVPVPDSPGNAAIDVMRYHTYKQFPALYSLGICSCRRVAGSKTWSQHSYCNAEDFGGGFAVMAAAADWLVDNSGSRGLRLPVAQVIFNRRVWEPSSGWRYYGGSDPHTSHIHVTGAPMRTGVPPCDA